VGQPHPTSVGIVVTRGAAEATMPTTGWRRVLPWPSLFRLLPPSPDPRRTGDSADRLRTEL